MDGTTIGQEVLVYLAAQGIELSEDLGQAEAVVREQLLEIGARTLELRLTQRKPGYEGSSRRCPCGQRQRFVEYGPERLATLVGTVRKDR